MRDEQLTDADAGFPFQRLTRDILVNVIANLIAAALIYIVGAVVGFLPFEPRAILVATIFLTTTLALLAFVAAKTYSRSRKQHKQDASLIMFTISICLLSLSTILAAFVPDALPWWERIGYVMMGSVGLFVCYHAIRGIQIIRQIRQRHQAVPGQHETAEGENGR